MKTCDFYRQASLFKCELAHTAALKGDWIVSKDKGWLDYQTARIVTVNDRPAIRLKNPLSDGRVHSIAWWQQTNRRMVAVVDTHTLCVVLYKNIRFMKDDDQEFVL